MIKTRDIAAFFFCLALLSSGTPLAYAENIGEYGKADVEVDRSVLQHLDGYQPPPMFGAPPSERVVIPPPETPKLTAPDTKTLLDHPVENHHVLTIQQQGNLVPHPSSVPPIPQPDKIETATHLLPEPEDEPDKLPPIPPRKPSSRPAAVIAKEVPAPPATPPEKPKDIPAVAKPVVKKEPEKQAYKPAAPKSMPAVPSVKVEAKPIPSMSNLPPPTSPENVAKPSIGERMMDDALTRNMVKNEEDLRKAMGITASEPENEDMNEFSFAFKGDKSALDEDQKNIINQKIIKKLSSNTSSRLQIRAYASRTDGTESSARRISLSRALSVRSYLLEKGIAPTRIDVRALSDNTTDPQTDRIDMIFIGTK